MEKIIYSSPETAPDNLTIWRIVEKNQHGFTYVTNYGGSLLITKSGKHTLKRQHICICPAMLARSIRQGYKRFRGGGRLSGKLGGKIVHRVIYQAFHPNEDITGLQIDHIDGNRYNNRVDNLRTCTNLENAHFAKQIRRGKVIITNLQKSLFYVN